MHTSSVDTQSVTAIQARLDRLEQYLQVDPNNTILLIDAFETALLCAEFECANFHLRHGLALQHDHWGWRLRECDFWLAQRNFSMAQVLLDKLRAEPALPMELLNVVQHNLAYIDMQQGNYTACVERLSTLMEATPTKHQLPELVVQTVQNLWLRALHRTGEIDRAMQWAQQTDKLGQLWPAAQGIASLIALDTGNLHLARRWSETALAQKQRYDRPLEALTTMASLALGEGSATQARQLALESLQLQCESGRSWSVLAFADLLEGKFLVACDHFERSLQTMPEHIGTWHGLGWAQILLRKLDAARSTFEKALGMNRNFADSHGGLAVVLALQQQHDAARQHIERALRLDKTSLSAQYAQGILNGNVQDSVRFKRLVLRLLEGRASGVGGSLLDKVYEWEQLNRSGD